MPIEMPRGLPFSVDTWSQSSKRKRHHFLTHAHKDHSCSILTYSSFPIYATHLTKSLILCHYSQLDDSLFVGIEVGQSLFINDPDGEFNVTAFDANHCPGAVIFLFEGKFGNILHTGDCRLTPECLRCLPERYMSRKGKEPRCQLDCVFLDCTFGKFNQKFPSKHSAIQQVINCIWKHPAAPVVYLTCDLLGQEDILSNVSKTFGSKIFVDKVANPECFDSLMVVAPELVTEDPSSRFHMFDGFPKLCERAAAKLAEARANFQTEPLIIRPSAQWYTLEEENSDAKSHRKLRFNEAVKDQFGVWHVCYPMHSSREELESALQLLMPKWVVSTTPSCRASELDYVIKHCFGTHLTSGDIIWKLLDISVEASSESVVSAKSLCHSPVNEAHAQIRTESLLLPAKVSSSSHPLSLSPPSKKPALTLFGSARFGIRNCSAIAELRSDFVKYEFPQTVAKEMDQLELPIEDVATSASENVLKSDVIAEQCEELTKKEQCRASCFSPIGSSKSFGKTMRKLYRTMNVPVPRPLPSLVKLKDANKGYKRRFEL